MIEDIYKLIEGACRGKSNFFGYGAWSHHILLVIKYAKLMAEKLGADKEIVEIAALLHDYASVKDYSLYKDHHIHGAKLAEEILSKYNYPKDKTEIVKKCILSHRGSRVEKKLSKEAVCIADADSMAHFDSIPSLFHLAFFSHKMDISQATIWVSQKLERSWNKLSPKAKVIMKNKYEASKLLFNL
jgi:uncharacterized protein